MYIRRIHILQYSPRFISPLIRQRLLFSTPIKRGAYSKKYFLFITKKIAISTHLQPDNTKSIQLDYLSEQRDFEALFERKPIESTFPFLFEIITGIIERTRHSNTLNSNRKRIGTQQISLCPSAIAHDRSLQHFRIRQRESRTQKALYRHSAENFAFDGRRHTETHPRVTFHPFPPPGIWSGVNIRRT